MQRRQQPVSFHYTKLLVCIAIHSHCMIHIAEYAEIESASFGTRQTYGRSIHDTNGLIFYQVTSDVPLD